MNAAELDADLWLDRARDLCGHREALVEQLKNLGTQLQTASSDEAAASPAHCVRSCCAALAIP